jgi:hypothetical protein
MDNSDDKHRCVKVSEGKLRYVEIDGFPDTPAVTMTTLIDLDGAVWNMDYRVGLDEIWADDGYKLASRADAGQGPRHRARRPQQPWHTPLSTRRHDFCGEQCAPAPPRAGSCTSRSFWWALASTPWRSTRTRDSYLLGSYYSHCLSDSDLVRVCKLVVSNSVLSGLKWSRFSELRACTFICLIARVLSAVVAYVYETMSL